MSDILALGGYQSTANTDRLFAGFGNDIVNVDTGAGYSQNLTAGSKGDFETYLDYCFYVNGVDATRSYNGAAWSTLGKINRAPIAKYAQVYGVKLYLGYLTINSQTYPSRVWHTDLPDNNEPRWGLEWGSLLSQTAASAVVNDPNADFEDYGIKAGDPIWILSGANAGQYTVSSVDTGRTLTLTEDLANTVATSTYIVGSNYFDVRTDDGDYLRGLGENSDRLLAFKLNSMHRYNGASLLQVKGVPGTSSNESIQNIKEQFTLWFHGSQLDKTGVYMYNGQNGIKVSGVIQPYIDGIAASIFPNVTAWREGDWYRCYVGDITNAQRNISVTKAVISYHVATNKWSVDPINKVPLCSTTFIESNAEGTFFGDDSDAVFKTPSSWTFDTSPIPWAMETGIHYPEGAAIMNKFTRIQVVGRDCRAIRARYKLYGRPKTDDTQWLPLDDLEDSRTQLVIPLKHNRASGINIRLAETSTRENAQYIEKIIVFYEPQGTRFI